MGERECSKKDKNECTRWSLLERKLFVLERMSSFKDMFLSVNALRKTRPNARDGQSSYKSNEFERVASGMDKFLRVSASRKARL